MLCSAISLTTKLVLQCRRQEVTDKICGTGELDSDVTYFDPRDASKHHFTSLKTDLISYI